MLKIPSVPVDEMSEMQVDVTKGCEEQMIDMEADVTIGCEEQMSDEEISELVKLTRFKDESLEEGGFSRTQFWKSLTWKAPPKEDPLSIEKKSIYFYFRMYTAPITYSWFELTIKDVLYPDPDRPESIWTKLPKNPDFGSTPTGVPVAVPPARIITFGGSLPFGLPASETKNVCHTISDGKVMTSEEFPETRVKRDYPEALVDDGKVYVYGGVRSKYSNLTGDFFIEVCDPDKGWFKSISYERKPPLWRHIPGGLFLDEHGRKHQLFHTVPNVYKASELTLLELESGAIHLAESPFPALFGGGSVVVDGFIYAYVPRTNDIRVYDLSKRRWIRGNVRGIDKIRRDCSSLGRTNGRKVFLHHLGGKKLCLIHEHLHPPPAADDPPVTSSTSSSSSSPNVCMTVAIKVFKVPNHEDDGLEARILSYKLCLFPLGAVLQHCLII